ncbi:hypothetical protein NITGR_280117 [Nitrospina gracilis 3/211]|uniref:Uncharacterized protein n=1 Tax=Nitrospina gracilis (strain 3/211) TaxID=1266370 RepID=M1YYR1_NITG3|nr:hypothetical protein NITGR_280117 [Nitrospina gracilis 3/211]
MRGIQREPLWFIRRLPNTNRFLIFLLSGTGRLAFPTTRFIKFHQEFEAPPGNEFEGYSLPGAPLVGGSRMLLTFFRTLKEVNVYADYL